MIVGITMQPQPTSAAHEQQQELEKLSEGMGETYGHHPSTSTEQHVVLHMPEETGFVMPAHESHMAAYSHQQPPSQVYVNAMGQPNAGMLGEIEQQFQRFSLLETVENNGENNTHSTVAAGDSSENNTEHNGSENTEEEPIKLFVGQVRKHADLYSFGALRAKNLGRIQLSPFYVMSCQMCDFKSNILNPHMLCFFYFDHW